MVIDMMLDVLNDDSIYVYLLTYLGRSQHAEWILNENEITFKGTFAGRKMHQGFRIYFV